MTFVDRAPASTHASVRRTATEPALRGLVDHAGMVPPAQKPDDDLMAAFGPGGT